MGSAEFGSIEMFASAWIGIIGTVVGALLAGGASWLNSKAHRPSSKERETKDLYLTRLEELYEVIYLSSNTSTPVWIFSEMLRFLIKEFGAGLPMD